jgi:hypothetical protein
VLTNVRVLFATFDVPGSARIPTYLAIVLITVASLYVTALRARRRAAAASTEVALESVNV